MVMIYLQMDRSSIRGVIFSLETVSMHEPKSRRQRRLIAGER